jgi:hypothetical protein
MRKRVRRTSETEVNYSENVAAATNISPTCGIRAQQERITTKSRIAQTTLCATELTSRRDRHALLPWLVIGFQPYPATLS